MVAKTIQYEYTSDELKKMIAEDLGVSVDKLSVYYTISPLDRWAGTVTVTKINVIVDNKE